MENVYYCFIIFKKKKKKKKGIYYNTDLPKYYAWLQMAVARGLCLLAGRLAGRHTDAAPKHSLCYFSFQVDVQVHRHTFAKQRKRTETDSVLVNGE